MRHYFHTCLYSFILFLAPLSAFAQSGDLFLQNYEVSIPNLPLVNQAVVQGNNELMYFANKRGVISYDGVSWELIKTNHTPYSLAWDDLANEKIYVGCRESFGYLYNDNTGKDIYKEISARGETFGEITKIIVQDEFVYFYSDQALFKASRQSHKVVKTYLPKGEPSFAGIFEFKGKIFLNSRTNGICLVEEKGFRTLVSPPEWDDKYMICYAQFHENLTILGMSDNILYAFNGNRVYPWQSGATDYLEGNVLSDAINLDEHLALSTLTGGVVLIRKSDKQIEYLINYQTGLLDEEVFSISNDNQGGIWICHAQGITRGDLRLPIRTFSTYVGLEGNLETSHIYKDTIYVATSDGLFYLSKVDRFEEVESFIKKEQEYLKTIESIVKTVRISDPIRSSSVRRYSLSRDGSKPKRRTILINEETEVKKVPARTIGTEYITTLYNTKEARKAYALQSIPYIFKKVVGIEAKCRQILNFKDHLLVASNFGLYGLKREKEEDVEGEPILPIDYIHYLHPSEKFSNRVYVGTDMGMVVLELDPQSNTWEEKARLDDTLSTSIKSIQEFGSDVWLGAEGRVFKVPIVSQDSLGKPKLYTFENNFSEDVMVRVIKDKLAFILASGIYVFSEKKEKLFKDARLQKYYNAESPLLTRQAGYTWNHQGKWQNISHPREKDSINTDLLDFFPEIKDIFIDQKDDVWLVDESTLYRVKKQRGAISNNSFNIFIRNMFQHPDSLLTLDTTAVFEYQREGVSLTFKLASPFYQNEEGIRYSYKLEGLSTDADWSPWNSQAIISFPYLPSGEYTLRVKAINIYNDEAQGKPISFVIKPPFWETTWFYILQISVLVALLFLSFLFSRRGKSSTVSNILTLVSIITIFEFFILLLEPYVEDFSNGIPIFKLGMNILLAITLSPAERLLKYLLGKPYKSPEAVGAKAVNEG